MWGPGIIRLSLHWRRGPVCGLLQAKGAETGAQIADGDPDLIIAWTNHFKSLIV